MNKLTMTQKYFIEILKDYLNGNEIKRKENIDYKELLDIARLQNLSAIVYDILKNNIPQEYRNAFKNDYDSTVFSNVNRNHLIKRMNKVLNENNIQYFIVKGVKVAELYPNPLLRTMGDTDMIMSSSDRIKADSLLINNLQFEKIADGNEWIYYKNQYEFELHDSLLYEDYSEKDYLNSFWDYVNKKEDGTYELDWSFHFVFLIAHLKKHILFEGAGFRQFIDIGLVTKKINLNWEYIRKTLKDLNLYDFCLRVLTQIIFGLGLIIHLGIKN